MVQVTAPCGNWTAEPGLVPACQCHRSGQPQSVPTPRLAPNAVPTPHGRRTDTAGPRFRIGDLHLLESPAFLCPRVQSGLGAIVTHMPAWSSLRTPRRGLASPRNEIVLRVLTLSLEHTQVWARRVAICLTVALVRSVQCAPQL